MKKKKINYRKTIFPKKPTYSNIMYYNSFSKLLLGMIVIILGFIMYHYITFNHHKLKIKTVTSYKDRYIIPENIVFLGDSITEIYELNKHYPDNHVVNSGISGNVTEDILNDMDNRVYRYNPSKVFLLIGTNQIVEDESKKVADDIAKISDLIHDNRPLTEIYVESIYPVNSNIGKIPGKRDNEKIIQTNKIIEENSSKYNYKYINLYDKLVDDDGNLNSDYTYDGLHINDKGFEKITDILKKYI